jgi:hypothetical protein
MTPNSLFELSGHYSDYGVKRQGGWDELAKP